MVWRALRRCLIVLAVTAVVVAVVRALRGPQAPAFDTPPPAPSGPPDLGRPVLMAVPDPEPWVAPVDGACPEGFPVKAKTGSGIYHLPGMQAYERTRPDRCYADAEGAEADGFRPAKR